MGFAQPQSIRHRSLPMGRSADALLAADRRDRGMKTAASGLTRVVLGTYYFEEEITPGAPAESEKHPPPPARIWKPR